MLKAHIGPEIGLCTDHFSQPQHQLLKFSKFAPAPRNAIFTNSCASRRREYGDAAPECQVTEGDGSNEECNDPPVSAMTRVRLLTRSVWRPRTREGGLCGYGVSGEVAVVLRAARLPVRCLPEVHTRTCTHARTYTHARTHARKHASTHAHTHTRTRTHTHTHTHTHSCCLQGTELDDSEVGSQVMRWLLVFSASLSSSLLLFLLLPLKRCTLQLQNGAFKRQNGGFKRRTLARMCCLQRE